jgi:hypothetical protein
MVSRSAHPRLPYGGRATFSGAEQAVYMVGGHRLSGQTTGEVWRYDMHSDEWTHLFLAERTEQVPNDVRAIAYDETTRKLVVIDEVEEKGGGLFERRGACSCRSGGTEGRS